MREESGFYWVEGMAMRKGIKLWLLLLFIVSVIGYYIYRSYLSHQIVIVSSYNEMYSEQQLPPNFIFLFDTMVSYVNKPVSLLSGVRNNAQIPAFPAEQDGDHPYSDSLGQTGIRGQYRYSLSLERLSADLLADRIDFLNESWVHLASLTPSTPTEQYELILLNNYRHPKKNTDQILQFLKALSHYDLDTALALLKVNQGVLPFEWMFDDCRNISYQKWEKSLIILANCDTWWGPEDMKMKIFIAGNYLYLYFLETPHTTKYIFDANNDIMWYEFATGNVK